MRGEDGRSQKFTMAGMQRRFFIYLPSPPYFIGASPYELTNGPGLGAMDQGLV